MTVTGTTATCTSFNDDTTGCFPTVTTIKIANIRVNVSGLAFPAQVGVIVSMTGPSNIPIFPNVLNIALPLTGLTWSVEDSADPDEGPGLQCEEDERHVEITLTEGFATSSKTTGVPTFTPGNTQGESGYFSPGSGATGGGATQGTRFKIWFLNVPSGVDVSVDLSMNNATLNGETDDCSDPSNWDGDALCLHLISGADASGAGGSPAAYPGDDPTASNPSGTASVDIDSNGMGMVVYEVLDANPFVTEESKIAAWFHWTPDTANDEPTPGTAQIRANLAPIATGAPYGFVADSISPRPRFIDLDPQGTIATDAFSIQRCTDGARPQALGVLSCSAAPVTPLVRVEGVAEPVGDIVITCTNTPPAAGGEFVQYLQTNMAVLTPNTNITNSAGKVTGGMANTTECQGRSKFGPLRRSKSRPVGEGVAVFVGRLERSLRSPFRAAQA